MLQIFLYGIALLIALILKRKHFRQETTLELKHLYKLIPYPIRTIQLDIPDIEVTFIQVRDRLGWFASFRTIAIALLPVVPIRQQIVDVVRYRQYVATAIAEWLILEEHLSLNSHAIDDAGITIVDDKKLILFLITLLHKANNIDTIRYTRHKLRN